MREGNKEIGKCIRHQKIAVYQTNFLLDLTGKWHPINKQTFSLEGPLFYFFEERELNALLEKTPCLTASSFTDPISPPD
jgi:hypothetical protein